MHITYRFIMSLLCVWLLSGCSGYSHNLAVPFISYAEYTRQGEVTVHYMIRHPAQRPDGYWCYKDVQGREVHKRELTHGEVALLEDIVPRMASYQSRRGQEMYALWAQTIQEELIVEGWFEKGRHQDFVDTLKSICDAKELR